VTGARTGERTAAPTMASAVTPEELVARARALVPNFLDRQEATEADRKVPQESIEDCHRAGLFGVVQPRRYGGFEFGMDTLADVAATVASGCGSTGWVFAVNAQQRWIVAMFPEQAQDEVWADERTSLTASSFHPSGTAVPADGGWRLSGKWMYCSGIDSADWLILGCRLGAAADAAPGDPAFMLVPKADVRIEDNWQVAGLAGTGSLNVIGEELYVPAHRVLRIDDANSGAPPGAAVNKAGLYTIPLFAATSIGLCGSIMGMAEGAFAQYVGSTRTRKTRGAAVAQPRSMAELPTIQLRVGEAASAIDAARMLIDRDCKDIMATVDAGKALTQDQRARNKGDLAYAVHLATGAIDRLFESGGGGGMFAHSRVQRFWRDAHAGAMHISMNRDALFTLRGRIVLGLDPGPAQF